MGAAYNYDVESESDFFKFRMPFAKGRDFALDFDEVVPLFYTNILLVEDDFTTASAIKLAMKRASSNPIRIRSFTSAEKAGEYILSLKKHHLPGPEIAIVDYLLSGSIDGLWICKLLEREFPETQAILISGVARDKIKNEMEARQTKPMYMQKPFNPAAIENLLG